MVVHSCMIDEFLFGLFNKLIITTFDELKGVYG